MTNPFENMDPSHLSLAAKIAMGSGGGVALLLALKIGRFIFKILLTLLALALLGGVVYWHFLA